MERYLLGFFVGFLCGIIPLVFGLLTKQKLFAIIGLAASSLSGVLFIILNKSPFTAIGVAILFIISNFAIQKRNSKHHHYDEYTDDPDED